MAILTEYIHSDQSTQLYSEQISLLTAFQRHPLDVIHPLDYHPIEGTEASRQNEIETYRQFQNGIPWYIPLKLLQHPNINKFHLLGDKTSINYQEMEIAGHAIIDWQFNGGYIRLASYALGHHPGFGVLINDGFQGNETRLERNVYINHPAGLEISDDRFVTIYPQEIKDLLVVFNYGYNHKDLGAINWAKSIAQSKGYDFEFFYDFPRVVIPGSALLYKSALSKT